MFENSLKYSFLVEDGNFLNVFMVDCEVLNPEFIAVFFQCNLKLKEHFIVTRLFNLIVSTLFNIKGGLKSHFT